MVGLEYDGPRIDPYGRVLAYLWIDGKMFNKILIEEAFAYIAYVFDPPYKCYDEFMNAQERARKAKRGIWNDQNYKYFH